MLFVPDQLLSRLELEDAVEAEAASSHSLLPEMPGLDQVRSRAKSLARWLRGQLRAGMRATPQVVAYALKAPHGLRPVPIWGFPERVTYRALVSHLLRNEPSLDRSPAAYRKFLAGPLQHALDIGPHDETSPVSGEHFFKSSPVRYVVTTDIASFYEYIDHGILARELLARTGDNPATECLMSLLSEVQGRNRGLPQLLPASDHLSDIYIDAVEREVHRRGWPVWRYNDDFRVATRSYSDALAAIEDIAAAARAVGLTLNDQKTRTPSLHTYASDYLGVELAGDVVPDDVAELQTTSLESDYGESAAASVADAVALICNAYAPADDHGRSASKAGLDLTRVRGDSLRDLRQAFTRLRIARVADALPHVRKILAYVPSITPWAIRYVMAAGEQDRDHASRVLGDLIECAALSDWQRCWVVRALHDLSLLREASADGATKARWVRNLLHGRHSDVLRAEAAMSLACAGAIHFVELEYFLRTLPTALSPWILTGIRALHGSGAVTEAQMDAVRGDGGIYREILLTS